MARASAEPRGNGRQLATRGYEHKAINPHAKGTEL